MNYRTSFGPAKVAGRHSLRPLLAALFALLVVLGPQSTAFGAESESAFDGVVNLNTASVQELQLLPGVGESKAAAILSARKERGGFKSVEELEEVKGFGPTLMERLRPHVTLKGQTTAKRS